MKHIVAGALLVLIMNTVLPQDFSVDDCINVGQFMFRGDVSLLEDGYCDHNGRWVPGLITKESYARGAPQHTKGNVVWYSPGVMEEVAAFKGRDLTNFVDGVALMSVADVGQTVWLKRPGGGWEGPFLVVDCSAQYHMFSSVYYGGEVAEIGFKTAQAWGMANLTPENTVDYDNATYYLADVEVYKGDHPPADGTSQPVSYPRWWMENTRFTNGLGFPEIMNH